MKSILLKGFAGAGLLVFSLTANAQDRPRDDDSYHTDRDARFHGENWRGSLFERVRDDVQHVRSVTTWPQGGDDYRLDRTLEELTELQNKLAQHVYDERELDQVIEALGRVASYNRMAPRDRDILTDDVSRMREYRDHHADWFQEHER
jgi:hypothetical protein